MDVEATYLSGDSVTIEDCSTIRAVKVKIAQLHAKLIPDVRVLSVNATELGDDEIPHNNVYVLLDDAPRFSSFWCETLISHAKEHDIDGIERCKEQICRWISPSNPPSTETSPVNRKDAASGFVTRVLRDLCSRRASLSEITTLIQSKADVNGGSLCTDNCPTALWKAVERGSFDVCEVLINEKADVNALNTQGRTPLFVARDVRVCALLIANGACVNKSDIAQETPLFASTEYPEVCTFLLAHSASVNHANKYGETALFCASHANREDACELLLNANANVHHTSIYGETALFGCESSRVCEVLIHAKADVNHKRNYNETFLFEAAQNGIVELAECLLAGGAEIDHANVFGETPLFHAAVNGHSELCYMLLQSGAKVNYESSADKSTALFRAARYGYTRVCEVLLAARADIHKTDINQQTVLFSAVLSGDWELCDLMIRAGVNVRALDKNQLTAQAFANDDDIILLLEESG